MILHDDLNLGTKHDNETDEILSLLKDFPYRPTIYIGLGGTGAMSVNNIKMLFRKLYEPKKFGEVEGITRGIPACYSFLAFDTNVDDKPSELAKNREWFHLSVDDLPAFYRERADDRFFRDWVIKGFPAGALVAGASGYRNLGRLAFVNNISKVKSKIDKAAEQIMAVDPELKQFNPVVYIFGSVSGGTGSGMLLDTAFMVRKVLPQADVIGFIGVFDGLPNMPETRRRELLVNTFVGLKELNAFMTDTADNMPHMHRERYPDGIDVVIRRPFDECYLISRKKADGTVSLETQGHFTSFTARMAFMMSAYCFQVKGNKSPDYNGVMNNHRIEMAGNMPYLVPGMGQVHFPIVKTANLFALNASIAYLQYQSGGVMREGDKEAREFTTLRKINYNSLQSLVGRNPDLDGNHPLVADRYDEIINQLLKKTSRNADVVLDYGDRMQSERFSEIESTLQTNIDLNLEDLWENIVAESNRFLVDKEYLAKGSLDFLIDLKGILQDEIVPLDYDSADNDAAYEGIEKEWSKISQIVRDVVEHDGPWDAMMDRFRLPNARTLYISFLNDAEMIVLDKVKSDLTRSLMVKLIDRIDDRVTKMRQIFESSLESALELLKERRSEILADLYEQTKGNAPDVENICSFNVMNQEWRNAYYKARTDLKPENVLGELIRRGWHPANLIDEAASGTESFTRNIAQQVLKRVAQLTEEDRNMTPIEILKKGNEYKEMKAEDVIADLYFRLLSPQMQTTGMFNRVGQQTSSFVFCGGISPEMEKLLKRTEKMGDADIHVSNNLETNRINFFTSLLPISIAGCDMVQNVLRPVYNRWLEELEAIPSKKMRDFEIAKFHCYPKSYWWPDPDETIKETEREKEIFAKALALSIMLDPDDKDTKKMNKFKTPKKKSYGIFQYGKSQFWMMPFFEPQQPRTRIEGKLISLGPNIFDAFLKYGKDEQYMKFGQQWANWFQENWSGFYNGKELDQKKEEVINVFADKRSLTNISKQIKLWNELSSIIDRWEIG